MTIKQAVLFAFTPLSLMVGAKVATAHAIQTDYQLHFDALEIQATFGDGESFPGAPVMIYSPENPDEPVLMGRTDSEGKFSFQPDQAVQGEWAVEIGDAESSHWDYLVVPVNEAGVELEAISQSLPAETQEPHRHDVFAYSFALILITLGAIAGLRFLSTSSTKSVL
ncbi:hypothetical protein Lepto7376_1273 [[Leptolyngbya] sp. PCC 7376]|uniref:hypothetical protein n=1 Tax=[Leptolyngbya] sp. PCC 7376 TaxID=111781 RepID=UPI00029ECCB0|nr:hypothetical protein [[Leptolyngbya] sp. PCC 7376]AFY37626.1 hypothetical protein Lepto7376_1273 [[Leptolyngbya] sp. PCC 7376]